MYGDAATKQNGWAFDYLPKVDRNYSWVQMWDNMYNGIIKGFFAFGMNGVAIGPDSRKNIDALKKADWVVVGEIYPDETSEFWRSPGITTDEMKHNPDHRVPLARAPASPKKTAPSPTPPDGCNGKMPRFRCPAIAASIKRSSRRFS